LTVQDIGGNEGLIFQQPATILYIERANAASMGWRSGICRNLGPSGSHRSRAMSRRNDDARGHLELLLLFVAEELKREAKKIR
jgi:hypothetical protein